MTTEDDENREFLRDLFAGGEDVPADVVPPSGLTVEDLRQQSDAAGNWTEVTIPGEIMLDPDGKPIGFGPSHTEDVYNAGTAITQDDVDRLGIDPADFPGITVMPNPTPKDET